MEPTVSVIMITYKHEAFIKEAIDGVLMQDVNFDVELIIVDDNSPDETESVVNSFQNHPNAHWIKYSKHPTNMGMMPNFIWALKQCKGKYIALCEGDDYWTDPLKLQKQVDFLEKNKEYSMCFHRTDELVKNDLFKKSIHTFNSEAESTFVFEDLARRNIIHTVSVVFRNDISDLPVWYFKSDFGDYPLWMVLAKRGPIYYHSETMAIYRLGVGVLSRSSSESLLLKWLDMLCMLKVHFDTSSFNFQINETIDKIADLRLNICLSSSKILSKKTKVEVLTKAIISKLAKIII